MIFNCTFWRPAIPHDKGGRGWGILEPTHTILLEGAEDMSLYHPVKSTPFQVLLYTLRAIGGDASIVEKPALDRLVAFGQV